MLKLRFAAGGYDRLDALQYGLVKPEGINLEFNEINAPRQIFDGMLGGGLYDVSEFSSSEFITRTLRGNFPFVGIPVFASSPFGGPAYFIGPSAGYLMGMLLSCYFVGLMAEKNYDKNYFKTLIILFLGSIIIFVPGLIWLGFWYNILWTDAASVDVYQSYSKAISNGLLLYKFTEPVKIALAATITPLIWQFIKNK